MSNLITGSCFCGAVKLTAVGLPQYVVNCHCNRCKKRNGSALSTYVAVEDRNLEMMEGEKSISTFEIHNSGSKCFCSNCGTPIYKKNNKIKGMSLIYIGIVDDDHLYTPQLNVYVSTKSEWITHISEQVCFENGPNTNMG